MSICLKSSAHSRTSTLLGWLVGLCVVVFGCYAVTILMAIVLGGRDKLEGVALRCSALFSASMCIWYTDCAHIN